MYSYFGAFPCKISPFSISRKFFLYYCYQNSCLFSTYFVLCYARKAYVEIFSFGIANPDPNVRVALLLSIVSQPRKRLISTGKMFVLPLSSIYKNSARIFFCKLFTITYYFQKSINVF